MMNRSNLLVFLAFFLWLWGGCANSNILVVAPHPDDDIITSSGVIYAATQRGEQVTVVYVTNGDFIGLGDLRQDEATTAETANLGTRESDLIFLGYPDAGLDTMYVNFPLETDRYLAAPSGHTTTYAHRGLGATDYHNYRFGSHANYNRFNLLKDLKDIIDIRRPEHIITVTEFDQHLDHITTYKATRDAIQSLTALDPSYVPVLNTMMVWSTNSTIWPEAANPQTYFNEPPGLAGTGLVWTNRESLDVPLALQATDSTNPKSRALSAHVSQGGTTDFIGKFLHKDEFFWPVTLNGGNFPPIVNAGVDQSVAQGVTVVLNGSGSKDPNGTALTYQWRQIAGPTVTLANATSASPSFVAPSGSTIDRTLVFELRVTDGVLNTLPDHVSIRVLGSGGTLPNIASLATVTASTQNIADNQQAIKAVDGIVDGYPGDYTREWATVGEKANAWIQLNWSTPYEVSRIVLHDRPNLGDMITSATLTFSGGTSITIGALDNAGAGMVFNVGPFITTSLRMTVTTVSGTTQNVGLSEIEVYGAPPNGSNIAPIANAGPDQTVAQGVLVNLNGNSSSDPNGTPITFKWVQTAGPSVALTGATTATPSFTSPVNLTAPATLTFALTVNDGTLNSVADSVNIIVTAPTGVSTNIAPLATVTASSQNVSANQQAVKAVDGIASGYPIDATREWATVRQKAGAWIQLNWSSFYQVDHVTLYDRPNTSDQITGATLTFSDNSTVTVGALNNNGTGVTVNFTPRLTNSIRMTVTSVSRSTSNVGLSEFQVYGVTPVLASLAPIANAGLVQTVNAGASVFLDGRLSADPNNDVLTYRWTQTPASTVVLRDATTATPAFIAPSNLTTATVLTFSLVVNDGHGHSTTDSVKVTVTPAAGMTPVANLSPVGPLVFDDQNVGTASTRQLVTLSNTGTGSLAITNIAATPSFSQTNTCGVAVAAGASCTINVTFVPTVAGVSTGTLTFTDNSNGIVGSTQVLALTGMGVGR